MTLIHSLTHTHAALFPNKWKIKKPKENKRLKSIWNSYGKKRHEETTPAIITSKNDPKSSKKNFFFFFKNKKENVFMNAYECLFVSVCVCVWCDFIFSLWLNTPASQKWKLSTMRIQTGFFRLKNFFILIYRVKIGYICTFDLLWLCFCFIFYFFHLEFVCCLFLCVFSIDSFVRWRHWLHAFFKSD